jgi:hypothetical protein
LEGDRTLLEARGAPRDQGIAQGVVWRNPIRLWLRREARSRGAAAWRDLRRTAVRGPLLALGHYLAQIGERMEGIALGAQLPLQDLATLWATTRCAGLGEARGGELRARIALSEELAALATLRRSQPDAAGFASLELALAPFPGCLAGVNERGVGIAVLGDRGPLEIPLPALAQDFLLRASSLAAGLAHLRLRARYAGGSGRLLIADARGRAVQVSVALGECAERDVGYSGGRGASTARIDLARRELQADVGGGRRLEAELGI